METNGDPLEATPEPDRPRLRRAAAIAAAVVALGCVPYLLGWAWTPAGYAFLPYRHLNTVDAALNLGWIERARAGEVLLRDPFTADDVRYVRPTYVLLGNVGRLTGLSGSALFQLGRVAFGLLALLAVYRLAVRLLDREVERLTALLLLACGSGLSWAAITFTGAHGPFVWPDSSKPEATLVSSLLADPHLIAAWWLLLELTIGLIDGWRAPDARAARRPFALAAGATCWLLFDQPYQGPLAVVLTIAVPLCLRDPAAAWRSRALLAAGLLVPAAALPTALLSWTVAHDPNAGALIGAGPSPLAHLGTFGLLWGWAAAGAALARRDRRWRLLVAWSVAQGALLLLPIPLAHKFVEGWQLPLGLLGGLGLVRLSERTHRLLVPVGVVLTSVGAVFLGQAQVASYAPRRQAWRPPDRVALYAWLAEHTGPDDLVLADYRTGLDLPSAAGCRAVYGHPFLGPLRRPVLDRLAEALADAERTGAPPRFPPPLDRIRFVVARVEAPGSPPVLVLEDLTAPAPRPRVEAHPAWGEPAYADGSVAVYAVD